MPDLTPQIERELAALEAALAPACATTRPAPDDAWVAPAWTRMWRRGSSAAPRRRPSRGRRWCAAAADAARVRRRRGRAAGRRARHRRPDGGGDSGDDGGVGRRRAPRSRSRGGGGGTSGRLGGRQPLAAAEEPRARRAAPARAAGARPATRRASAAEPPPVAPPGQGEGSPGSDGRERRKRRALRVDLTLAARPRDIDAVARQVSDLADAAGRLRRLLDGQLLAHRRRRHVRAARPERNLDATMAELSRLGAVRERAQRTQDITAAGRLGPRPAPGRAHRAPQPAAPARGRDDAARPPRRSAPGSATSRRDRGRPRRSAAGQQPRGVRDRHGHAGRGRRRGPGRRGRGRRRVAPGDAARGRAARARGHRRRRAHRARRAAPARAARRARAAGSPRAGRAAARPRAARSTPSDAHSTRPMPPGPAATGGAAAVVSLPHARGNRTLLAQVPSFGALGDTELEARRRGGRAAQLRRRRGDLPRGRRLEHAATSSAPATPARSAQHPDGRQIIARHVRPGRHLRRAGDVRRRAALGHRRGHRRARGRSPSSATTCAG